MLKTATTEQLLELAIRSVKRMSEEERRELREMILSRGNQRLVEMPAATNWRN
jgi:hypothetical protein